MTSPLSPEAVAQMVTDLRAADKPLIQSGPFIQTRERLRTAADMLTTLAAENATLRAERDEAQSELDDYHASDWPIWAKQIYNTLKEFGYRYDHFDGIDLPEDVSEFLRGFPENAASELMEQRDDALQELATLRAEQAMLKFDIDKMLTQIEEHNAAWDELRASEAAAMKALAEIGAVVTAIEGADSLDKEIIRNIRTRIAALTPTADKEPKT